MKEQDIRTTKDLLAYLNKYPFEAILEFDGTEIDAACRIKDIGLDYLTDEVYHLDIELIHIDNMKPDRFTPEMRAEVTARMLYAWSVRDEARLQCVGVLDAIQESSGYRGDLASWLEEHDQTEDAIERRAASVDFYHDQRKEAING